MILFLFVLAYLVAIALLWWTRGDGQRSLRLGAIAVLAFLPALYAAVLLLASTERIGQTRFDYVGKRLAFGPGLPLTAGGSGEDSESYEDLHHGILDGLPPRAVALREVAPGGEDEGDGGSAFEIHLESPSPIVRLEESGHEPRILNAYPLRDGDRLAFDSTGVDEILFAEGLLRGPALVRGDARYALDDEVIYLPEALRELGLEKVAGEYRSVLTEGDDGWLLLLREDTLAVVTPEGERKEFVSDHPLRAADLGLSLQVAWASSGRYYIRTLRRDHLLIGDDDAVEVRFGEHQRRSVEAFSTSRERLTLAVVVPGSLEEQAMIEFDDASPRLRGVSALFEEEAEGEAYLTHLGRRERIDFGTVYSFGEGQNRLLVRISRESFPLFLVVDLLLLGLFWLVFLGRGMAGDGALATVVGGTGLLMANRLLFAYRAAERPPDFAVDVLAEARGSLWLVAAFLLFFYAIAWLVATAGKEERGFARLAWPLLGLVAAAGGMLLVGLPGLLASLPLLMAIALTLLASVSHRRPVRERIERWRREGIAWKWWLPLAAGGVVMLLRLASKAAGMAETLRLADQRILWTTFQIPITVLVAALALELTLRLHQREGWGSWRVVRSLASLLAYFLLAFVAVGFLVGDLGLVFAQALPYAVALLGLLFLLVEDRRSRRRRAAPSPRGGTTAFALTILLMLLPMLGALLLNLFPERIIALDNARQQVLDRFDARDEGAETDEEPVQRVRRVPRSAADARPEIGSPRALRLYMLSNPQGLQEIGLVASERMAIHYSTLQSYAQAGGWQGQGYLATALPRYLGDTYLSDLVPMVFVLPEQGKLGLAGLGLLYTGLFAGFFLFAARPETGTATLVSLPAGQASWLSAVALLAFVVPSLFMILSNLNLAVLTGKNCSLLGVNSLSEALESATVLGLAVLGLALRALPREVIQARSRREDER